MMNRRHFVLMSFFVISFVIGIVQCTHGPVTTDARGEAYAANETCVQCHQAVVQNYEQHAHFHTTQTVPQFMDAQHMQLHTDTFIFNGKTKLGVEYRKDAWYQVAYVNGQQVKEERMDIAFGAGRSAYTFAFWYGNKLMQFPLNYLAQKQEWVNSPGFPSEQIYFGRAIVTRCLECHSSFVQARKINTGNLQMEETFEKNSLILGIDCQRCHGPAAAHVQFHQAHPDAKEAQHMVRFAQLSRSQKMDACGVCHSGANLQMLNPIFFFKPGDTLLNLPEYSRYTGEDPDVHGKQKQLLEASKCYQLSNLDCTSCHAPHGKAMSTIASYSQKCIQCHQQVKHTSLTANGMVRENCIDCHMPLKVSKDIGFQRSNSKEKIPYKQRTHRIAVYPSHI